MTIVIAEDERIIALSLSMMLKRLGHEIRAFCPSGELCVESVERERPDVVFMDILMDGQMDGIEAAGIVRSRFGTPVIFTTAYDDPATRKRAAALGPMAFLTKPVSSRMLSRALEGITHRSD